MQRFLILFAVLAGIGMYVGRQQSTAKPTEPARQSQTKTAGSQPTQSARIVTLSGDRSGSFNVQARIDGRNVGLVVDTGATAVAIRESTAANIGIRPSPRDYTVRMQTANGVGKAAPVVLDRIDIDGITVRNVRAVVVSDDALSTNLLGMSFLSKVKFTHDRGRLVLEQ